MRASLDGVFRPSSVAVIGASVFYAYHWVPYLLGEPGISGRFHTHTTILVLVWCLVAWIYQRLVLKPNPHPWLPYVWLTTDTLLLSWFLMSAAKGAHSSLVAIYFGLVAGAALWFKESVVRMAAFVVAACYAIVVLYSNDSFPTLERITYMETVPVILVIFIIAMIQHVIIWCIRQGVKGA